MVKHHIFSIENALLDIKDYILPYTELSNIRLDIIVQSMLDEVCYIHGNAPAEFSMDIGEQFAMVDLLGYDIPPVVCRSVVGKIKALMLDPLIPLLKTPYQYRLQHLQLNEYEYCISIYYYKAKRFQYNPHETCYATTIPHHWAQSID